MDGVCCFIVLVFSDREGNLIGTQFVSGRGLDLRKGITSPWKPRNGKGPICSCYAGGFLPGGAVSVPAVLPGYGYPGAVRFGKCIFRARKRCFCLIVRVRFGEYDTSGDSAVSHFNGLRDIPDGEGVFPGGFFISRRCFYLFPGILPCLHIV